MVFSMLKLYSMFGPFMYFVNVRHNFIIKQFVYFKKHANYEIGILPSAFPLF